MDARELAQALRHIAEELGGGGDVAQAVDALHDLAEEIDPGSAVAACGGGCAFCVTAFLSQSRAQVQKRKERCRQYEPEYERR